MFRLESQQCHNFHDLTAMQFGWETSVSQLGPSQGISRVSLYRTANVGYTRFRFGSAYDQRLKARTGLLSFGLLELDNPLTWSYDHVIPNNAITVFPRCVEMKAATPVGFHGNGMHFCEHFLEQISEHLYQRPLISLLPDAGIYLADDLKLLAVRDELYKWRQLVSHGAHTRGAIVARREECLALALLSALVGAQHVEKGGPGKAEYAMNRALEMIHSSELESISAVELCTYAECSQRMLEKSFLKRFGVTPKRYIKCLRLARVHAGLVNFESQSCDSIIELAAIQGFWHMGQFAADYRRIYGELPSETLSRG